MRYETPPMTLAKKQIREATGEKDVDQQPPRHRDVGGQDHAQQEGGIENVAMHGSDVRHSPHQIGIPQRESVPSLERRGSELAKGIASVELIAAGVDQEAATERRKPQ
jgi:hypothetical protein